ncbi:MAG: MoaD/ThiS family protein [Burkholderiaceae bacterium]|uniref:MoaD/ThiS family protein n=1 Tax=Rubrivivax albus TaxID=2499835 RepID=A0A3S2TPM7_9BURK|nr:MoaD/ThiS family protein [Rubrivivax albus]MCP5272853.1 MoaD/ThiS family protein [Burkholderiaceae bacterium]RVT50075.1 MoaD/ThiS family protein [Rubrivivax albus]
MVEVRFTPQLRRFTVTPEVACEAATLRQALEAAFAANPRLRGYVLDDQGHVRPNVAIFVDGRRCADAVAQTDVLQPDSRIYVMQALSGG